MVSASSMQEECSLLKGSLGIMSDTVSSKCFSACSSSLSSPYYLASVRYAILGCHNVLIFVSHVRYQYEIYAPELLEDDVLYLHLSLQSFVV